MSRSFFSLFFLVGLAFSFSPEKFAPENASLVVESFAYNNSNLSAILVGGELYAFVDDNSAITETEKIKDILSNYYIWKGHSPQKISEFQKIHEGIAKIKEARKPGEEKCRILTGTDRHACDSFESCLQACYSVTSFCQPVALGAGKPFIQSILEFENQSKLLDEAYMQEEKRFSALMLQPNESNAQAYLSSLENINIKATKLSSNPLFDYYSFCHQPDYGLSSLTVLQLSAQKAYANMSPFFEIEQKASLISNNTKQALRKLSAQKEDLPPSNSTFSISNISGKVSQPSMDGSLPQNQTKDYSSQAVMSNDYGLLPAFAATILTLVLAYALFSILKKPK